MKIFLLTDKSLKFSPHEFFPKHINHFVHINQINNKSFHFKVHKLSWSTNFSSRENGFKFLVSKNINVKGKVSVVEIFCDNPIVNYIWRINSRFYSCCSVWFMLYLFFNSTIIPKEILAFCWLTIVPPMSHVPAPQIGRLNLFLSLSNSFISPSVV